MNFDWKKGRSKKAEPKQRDVGVVPVVARATDWFKSHLNEGGGIPISNRSRASYPEVTGYWIPTLIQLKENDLALDLGDWLCSVQLKDGSFRGADGKPHPFDTGQIIRGLHCLAEQDRKFQDPLRKACSWMTSILLASNTPLNPYQDGIPAWVLLYAYQPVMEAGKFLDDLNIASKAQKCLEAYASFPLAPEKWDSLTHFYGYWLEGLVDAGKVETIRSHLRHLSECQRKDGSLPAYPGAKWVCTPGLAQVALAWHKMGMEEPSKRALQWLMDHQNPSGGWFGSYGAGADYFADAEVSWTPKFVLDLALRLGAVSESSPKSRSRLSSEGWAHALSSSPSPSALAERVRSGERTPWSDLVLRWTRAGQSVLELGAGTGEIAAGLAFHDRKLTLLDQSRTMLKSAKELFHLLEKPVDLLMGDLEKQLPFSDDSFDVVFSSGVLEHYEDDVIAVILREFGRIAKTAVITLVPNAGSLPYRIGKDVLENEGRWSWGYERPIPTLRPQSEKAGLTVEIETTIGLKHSLNFLRDAKMQETADLIERHLPRNCGNGYLLATLARKKP